MKLHVMVGTVTHAVTSALVTSEGDCPQLPGLLARTRVHHDVREVSADKAYASVDNHEVLDRLDVAAYIPFKDNAVVNPKKLLLMTSLAAELNSNLLLALTFGVVPIAANLGVLVMVWPWVHGNRVLGRLRRRRHPPEPGGASEGPGPAV